MDEKNGNVLRHIRVGGIEATVWKNTNGGKEYLSVTLKRNYKDASGEWKSTHSFRQNDLPKAFEHIALSRAQ